MSTYQVLVLAGFAAGLVLLALIFVTLRELAPLGKYAKLRKPLATFLDTGTESMRVPMQIAEMTQEHMAQITTIAKGAVMGLDMMEHERRERDRINADLARKMPAPGTVTETGTLLTNTGPGAKGPEV